jgi:hypothetical protein
MDQTEYDRLSKDKSINNQARPKGNAAKASGGGNKRRGSMVEKRQWDKERKGWQMRVRDIK